MSFDIIFMGTPVFAKEFLDHICSKDNFNVKGVFTSPPKKSNRGQKINISPVQEFCEKKKPKSILPR